MTSRLAGKTAFLTAAAQGIGRATAIAFAREGARVIATDIDEAGLAALARECGCSVRRLDVTDGAAIAVAAREVGPVNVLFNAAGVVHSGNVLEATEADWDLAFNLNARAMARTIRAFLPGMLALGGGAIVNIASVSGQRGNIGRSAYGASKGGVITLTKVMASELAPLGIRVNAIAPGPIETPLVKAMHTDEVRAGWLKTVPQRRYALPEEIAGAAIFLLDEAKSSFVTGHILNVDGGFAGAGLLPAYP